MEAGHLRENPQTPQQQETLQAITQETQRNNKKLTSSGFKQQPICTPLAPTRNKIIYKTACSNGHNSGSGRPSQNRLRKRASLLSRSLYRSHVLTTFLGPVLGAMMKQVCWHSRLSKAYRGLPKARGQSEAHGDSNLYIILLLGWQWDTVVPSGLAKVLLFIKAAPVLAKKVTAESKTLALDSKKWSSPVALKN